MTLAAVVALLGERPVVTIPVPNLTATEVSLLLTVIIGGVSLWVNRRGAQESKAQQIAANELDRRAQGFKEMEALLTVERETSARLRKERDDARKDRDLLRELTRAQITIAEHHDLLPPSADEVPLLPPPED